MLASTAKSSSRFWAKLLKERLLEDNSGPHAFQGAPYSTSVGWPTRPTTHTANSTAAGNAASSDGTRTTRSSRQRCESKVALIARGSAPRAADPSDATCGGSSGARVVSSSARKAKATNANTWTWKSRVSTSVTANQTAQALRRC